MVVLLFLNSCERHSLVEPLDPHQDLKQWYAHHKMTTTYEPVLWEYTTPFAMPDRSQAYQIPVMSKTGMKDLIIYSENGVQKGFYKLYTPKDETHINIQVLNMFDEVIRDGVLSKTKRVAKAKKNKELDSSTIKEMNLDLPEVFCYGQRLPMEGTLGDLPVIYSGGGGSYFPIIPSFFGGGGGAPSGDEFDINFDPSAELLFSIGNNVKNKCLLEALNGVINSKYDLRGIINQFKSSNKTIYFTEVTNLPSDVPAKVLSSNKTEALIGLNLNELPYYSKELMAVVITHEVLHGYFTVIRERNYTEKEEHEEMADDSFLDDLRMLIIKRFPKTVDSADELIFTGLTNTDYFKRLKKDVQDYATRVIYNYKNGKNGTYCK
jgi:hypothetical protein